MYTATYDNWLARIHPKRLIIPIQTAVNPKNSLNIPDFSSRPSILIEPNITYSIVNCTTNYINVSGNTIQRKDEKRTTSFGWERDKKLHDYKEGRIDCGLIFVKDKTYLNYLGIIAATFFILLTAAAWTIVISTNIKVWKS